MTNKTVNEINSEEVDLKTQKDSIMSKLRSFGIESLIGKNKVSILLALIGLTLVGLGVFLYKNTNLFEGEKIEVIAPPEVEKDQQSEIIVEISGAVTVPGVYKLKSDSRVNDLLIASDGLSATADRVWVEKYINRAAKLMDGQKMYIKAISEQTVDTTARNDVGYQSISPGLGVESQGLVNINTSSFEELDKLPGIGQVYGQKIIEQRPYSACDDLLSRKILPKSTYEKIKDKITVN